MAIPVSRTPGAKVAGTGAVTPALPANIAVNDIAILCATTIAGGSISITVNGSIGTWTAVTGSPIDVTGGDKLYIWWGRYTSGSTGPTLTPGSDHICAGINAYGGCETLNSPIHISNTGTEATSDTTLSFTTGISTSVNDCMIILVSSTGNDGNTAQHSAQVNTNLSSIAEKMDYCTNSGGGGGFEQVQGGLSTAGAIGTWTATLATASPKAYICFALKPPQPQTISSAGNINTGFAAGLATLILAIAAAGAIASAEIFGTTQLNQNINSLGIVSGEAFGVATIYLPAEPQEITDAGNIASGEAFGTAKLDQSINPSGIASAETHGSQQLNQNINPSGITTGEDSGTAKIDQNISVPGIDSAESFGNAQLNQNLIPAGIASAEAFGNAIIALAGENQDLYPSGIASGEAFGTSKLSINIQPAGIASGEIFGTAKLDQNILPASIGSGEIFGNPIIILPGASQNLYPPGIESSEIFGSARIFKGSKPVITKTEITALFSTEKLIEAMILHGLSITAMFEIKIEISV